MKWTRKHQNPSSASTNFVFRSSMNKDEQDLPLKQKRKASEGFNSAMKRAENVVSKVFGLNKRVRKHRSDSKPNEQRDASRRQCQTEPNKELAGCWIKAKV